MYRKFESMYVYIMHVCMTMYVLCATQYIHCHTYMHNVCTLYIHYVCMYNYMNMCIINYNHVLHMYMYVIYAHVQVCMWRIKHVHYCIIMYACMCMYLCM